MCAILYLQFGSKNFTEPLPDDLVDEKLQVEGMVTGRLGRWHNTWSGAHTAK